MFHPPAYCPRCQSVFPVRGISFAPGAGPADLAGNITNCPVCGYGAAEISDGVYKATEDAIELLSGPDSTRERLRILKELAEGLVSGKITKDEALEKADTISPRYRNVLQAFWNFGMPALALLIAIIGVYLAHDDSKSSSEDSARILEALEGIKNQIYQSAAPGQLPLRIEPRAKRRTQSIEPPPKKLPQCKAKSKRRAEVNRDRREKLKERRSALNPKLPPT
jgi:hypothetical protein